MNFGENDNKILRNTNLAHRRIYGTIKTRRSGTDVLQHKTHKMQRNTAYRTQDKSKRTINNNNNNNILQYYSKS